jgi:exodeoxyribonuclease VII large subunit
MTQTPYSVSDFTALVRDALAVRPELEDVLVEGEVSNLSAPSSGHLYFTLKDQRSALACVCFRSHAARIPFKPENGMTVVAHGSVQVYEAQGRYQLYVDRLDPSGVGALALAIEQLKRALAAQGVFEERSKRRIPLLPRRVVVVTSRTGAAFRDVYTVMTRRAPGVDIVLSPATMQGEGAADTIVQALRRADAVPGADVIVLVRGGGSLEDLMPFNTEAVARAIRACRLPVVTGVGHETDTTIADLAADRRGATPSAAAELVAPSAAALQAELAGRTLRLGQAVRDGTGRKRRGLETAAARLERLSPSLRLGTLRQDLDRRSDLLRHALLLEVSTKRRRLDRAAGGLRDQQPLHRLAAARAAAARLGERLVAAGDRQVEVRHAALASREARLEALSPRRTLERGYSITLNPTGRVVTAATAVQVGERIRTVLSSGELASTVTDRGAGADTENERMYDNPAR